MRAQLIEGARSAAVLGLSPWILPLIAIAAKRKTYDVRDERCARVLRSWFRMRSNAGDPRPEDAVPEDVATNKAVRTKLESMIRHG